MGKATILACAIAFLAGTPAAGENIYGWSISGSSVDPIVNTGTPTFGVVTKYLWFNCSVNDGMAAAEFDLAAEGIVILATTAVNGYLNAGGSTNVLLAVGGCPTGPVVAANILVLDLLGSICFVPSANGVKGTVDCQASPMLWPIEHVGYDNTGGTSCEKGLPWCYIDLAVEERSWGAIKGLYR